MMFAVGTIFTFGVYKVFHAPESPVGLRGLPLETVTLSTVVGLPQPPSPYHYSDFMAWLKHTNFSTVKGLKWHPDVAEFNISAAAKGKFGPWLTGSSADMAISTAKGINKWVFMQDIMSNGNLGLIGAPGMHLYILRRLLEASKESSHPTFLDAGCGPGYLLMAWALAAGGGSHAVGIDIDKAVIASAQRYLADPAAFDADAVRLPKDVEMEAHVGDALNPDIDALGLEAGSVDAVNMGLAVRKMEDLAPMVRLLREGGLLAAPICKPSDEQPSSVSTGKCAGLFKVFRKGEDGVLKRMPDDPDIPVTFVVALRPEELAATAQAAKSPGPSQAAGLRGKQ